MSRIIVAGGTGFIGSHLVKKFLDEGHKVFILDANINYFYPLDEFSVKNLEWRNKNLIKDAKIFKFNLNDIDELRRTIDEINPTHIVNLAALPLAKNAISDTDDAFNSIIVNAKNFMEILRDKKSNTKFIHISSSMIYGDFEKEPNFEEASKDPKEIYGSFKYASEVIVKGYAKIFDINLNIIRPTAVYGPTDNNRRVIQTFIEKALKNETIYANNPENNFLDFTYVDDAAEGIKCVTLAETPKNEAFNISYGKANSIMTMINILREYFPKLKFEAQNKDTFYPKRGSLDISKAKKYTNYQPKTDLKSGIKKYIDFINSNLI
jgi:nucleoside-diphosphate-sugar epimerase